MKSRFVLHFKSSFCCAHTHIPAHTPQLSHTLPRFVHGPSICFYAFLYALQHFHLLLFLIFLCCGLSIYYHTHQVFPTKTNKCFICSHTHTLAEREGERGGTHTHGQTAGLAIVFPALQFACHKYFFFLHTYESVLCLPLWSALPLSLSSSLISRPFPFPLSVALPTVVCKRFLCCLL